jgi:hypothetical protein
MTERMTAEQYQAAQRVETGQGEDRRRVRGAQRTTTADGITHDSKTEAQRWEELKLLQMAGSICGPVTLSCRPKCSFRPLSVRKRRGFSSPMLSAVDADCRSH